MLSPATAPLYISVIHRDTICPAWAYSPTIAATAPVPSP